MMYVSGASALTFWPDTTRVDWEGSVNFLCHSTLVYVILTNGSSLQDFESMVLNNEHTIWRWYTHRSSSIMPTDYTEIGTSEDIEETTLDDQNETIVRYALPVLLIDKFNWPDDDLYINEQWYFNSTATKRPAGGVASGTIRWQNVVNLGVEYRGSTGIKIGIVDTGLLIDKEDDFTHPDYDPDRVYCVIINN